MRARLLVIAVAAALLVAACVPRPTLPRRPVGDTIRVKVTDGAIESVQNVPLEDYVAIAALSELAPATGDRQTSEAMFEVQSIVARSYAEAHRGRHASEGFDLCSTTHCQIYEPRRLAASRLAPLVLESVRRTAGVILTYGGAPADAVYHADCGGWTSAAADVWKGPGRPYLIAQPDRLAQRDPTRRNLRDPEGAADAHAGWQYVVDRDVLQRALNADARTRIDGRLSAITVLSRDQSGRAQRVLVRGNVEVPIQGTDLREVLTTAFGARAFRSTLFDVVVNGRQFVFSGSGFGHGVGLCQVGALARVSAGESPSAVLQYYYPGTRLRRMVDGKS